MSSASGVLELVAKPVEAFVEAVTRGGAGCLDVPVSVSQAVKTQLVRDLCGVHGIWQILLVREDQQNRLPQFVLCKHSHQFLPCLPYSFPVIAVNDEDKSLGVLEVVAPQRLDLVENGGLPRSIEPDHQDPHLLFPEEALEERCKHVPHGGGGISSLLRSVIK